MYEALDPFLRIDTWHTGHPLDDRRFFVALARIVERPDFNAEDMRVYVRAEVNNPLLDYAVDRLVTKAGAVREYLEAVGRAPSIIQG